MSHSTYPVRRYGRVLSISVLAAALLAPAAAMAGNPNDASVYEVQNGEYGQFTFVICDSVAVTGAAATGFWVEEPGGGPRSGIWINAISATPPPLGPGTRVTLRGLYKEVLDNSEINISNGLGGYANAVDSTGTVPSAAALTVGAIRTGSPTAEDWEGVLVSLDTLIVVDTTSAGDWRVVEADGDAPGETLLVDNMMSYDRPVAGTLISSLTGIIQYIDGTDFALEPRNNYDILIPDSLPPAAISDMAAVSGSFQGEIDLTWTAPGDDGNTGRAFSYTVRRNSVAIDASNWASSTNVGGVPTPATAGTLQSMTVVGLDPGVVYFFAIMAEDEHGNEGAVSNSPSAPASTNPPISYQVYWGNLHSHTNLSDGVGTVLQAFGYARDTANVDILAITDHSHYLTASEYTSLRSISDQFNAQGGFVAIPAQELGIANSSGYGHMNVWDAPTVAGSSAFENLALAYNFAISVNKPASFNHPAPMGGESIFNNLAYNFSADAVVEGIEVRNGKRTTDYETQYLQALANGWHIGALSNQDNHAGKWGDQPNTNSGNDIYLNGILAESLTKEAVMEAIANRRFYANEINPSADRVTLNYSADGRIMGSIYTSADRYINLTATANSVSNLSTYALYRNGTVIKTAAIGATLWNFSYTDTLPGSGEFYYHLRLIQADGDRTWSSPIWVTFNGATSVAEGAGSLGPASLEPNFPNPFNPATRIAYSLPSQMEIELAIYDLSGRKVVTLFRGLRSAGRHEAVWGGFDELGNEVASGVYFAKLDAPGVNLTRKMVLLK